MTIEDRKGTAYHEAGHVVVAWALGLRVRAATIGVDGDDAKGKSDIEGNKPLQRIDRIALCAAGVEAQHVFGVPTHTRAGSMDEAEIIKLTKHLDNEKAQSAARDDGYRRAHELIQAHKAQVYRVAERLLAQGSIGEVEISKLVAGH